MATSVLSPDEEPELIARVKRCFIGNKDTRRSGTLIYTKHREGPGRVLFVAEEGLVNKKYTIHHFYSLDSVKSIRTEKRLIGTALVIDVKFPERLAACRYEGVENPELWVTTLRKETMKVKTILELVGFLKSKERAPFSEIQTFIKSKYPEFEPTIEDLVEWLRVLIDHNKIEGFIDEERQEFVHMIAYKQKTEVVHYTIAASFNFSSSGTLEIKCPHCGASQELTEKQKILVCKYCGKSYMIPEKILSLL